MDMSLETHGIVPVVIRQNEDDIARLGSADFFGTCRLRYRNDCRQDRLTEHHRKYQEEVLHNRHPTPRSTSAQGFPG